MRERLRGATLCLRQRCERSPMDHSGAVRALVLCRSRSADGACTRKRIVRRRRITGSPHHRLLSRRSEGLPGSWAVLFLRAVDEHPAGYDLPSPDLRRGRRRLQVIQHFGHPGWHRFRGRKPHGPHARVPTLRRSRCRDRRQARYRLGRAHPWPDGLRTRWTTNEVSWSHRILHSPSTSRAWSHCTDYPHPLRCNVRHSGDIRRRRSGRDHSAPSCTP